MPYRQHLVGAESLVTSYEQTRAGFVALALEKNRRATPFVEQARALKIAASRASSPVDLLNLTDIKQSLLTAAGVSDKAAGHLDERNKVEAIKGLIHEYLEPAGNNFVEELVYRFLLTRGDTLGGSMRNAGGALAQFKLTRALIATLGVRRLEFKLLHSTSKRWVAGSHSAPSIENHTNGLSWLGANGLKTLVYNRGVPLVRSNIDLIMLNCPPENAEAALRDYDKYIFLGELKGGIDPAGADEHWKTANTALNRIREAFEGKGFRPFTIFLGAAIESRMAEEIWGQLEVGILTNAANLTNDEQVSSVCNWICSL